MPSASRSQHLRYFASPCSSSASKFQLTPHKWFYPISPCMITCMVGTSAFAFCSSMRWHYSSGDRKGIRPAWKRNLQQSPKVLCKFWGTWPSPTGVGLLYLGQKADTKRKPKTAFSIFMVALCNRADHYIFILFLSSFFFLLLFFLA